MVENKPTVISLFSGCGGSSLGYKLAGFKELLAIDSNKNVEKTFKFNFPEVPFWCRDIRTVKTKEVLNFCKLNPKELDILDGSPPCQGFSQVGKRRISDSRNQLFLDFVRFIKDLKPKIFVMENVSGQIKGKMKGIFIKIMKKLKSLNYNVKCKLLNAKYYNVAQSRRRLFYIGVRKDLNCKPIYPTPNKKLIVVKEALKNCPIDDEIKKYTNKKDKYLLKYLKEGQGLNKIHPKGWGFNFIRIHRNRQCPTIIKTFRESQAGLYHYNGKRFLTISELKRLCSFPDNFKLFGSFEEKWEYLGNSVMPNQMKAIAETLKKEILKKNILKNKKKIK